MHNVCLRKDGQYSAVVWKEAQVRLFICWLVRL